MTRHIIQTSDQAQDGRLTAAAAERNTVPIIEALHNRLPQPGSVLELASGTGQHIAAFAAAFPAHDWQPSDVNASQRDSITAWRQASGRPNLAAPIELDIGQPWPIAPASVGTVLTINLFHLIPTAYVAICFHHARASLCDKGRMIVYGPFLRGSSYASDGDRDFDAALRDRDPAIGYKSVDTIIDMARDAGLIHLATDAMPANNLLLTFETG